MLCMLQLATYWHNVLKLSSKVLHELNFAGAAACRGGHPLLLRGGGYPSGKCCCVMVPSLEGFGCCCDYMYLPSNDLAAAASGVGTPPARQMLLRHGTTPATETATAAAAPHGTV